MLTKNKTEKKAINDVTYTWIVGNDGFMKLSSKTEEMLLEAERQRRQRQKEIDANWGKEDR